MKILLYNWVPFDELSRGGGVNVYTKNLVDSFHRYRPKDELFFLCSGVYYDELDTSVRIEKIENSYDCGCVSYAVINSPVFAPAFLSFFHMSHTMCSPELKKVFEQFVEETGPFDVIHFQNFEGLSLDVLSSKKKFADTKYVYSIHNYYPFCPQVNLWKNNKENCEEKDTGSECVMCMSCHVPAEKLIKKMSMTYELKKSFSKEKNDLFAEIGKTIDEKYSEEETRELTYTERLELENLLRTYRRKFVDAINQNMDVVLAVSNRVKEIAQDFGVYKDKIVVSYIGTKIAENAMNHCKNNVSDTFSIVYLGYRRKDKGFYFLVDVLNQLDEQIAKHIDVTLAAKIDKNEKDVWKIEKNKFHKFMITDGFARDELEDILRDANLGIVPAIWEDNLPQVAIEMVALGVPILCSDRGGMKELTKSNKFVFEAENVDDCVKKIQFFVENPFCLKEYYDDYKGLTTMEAHLKDLVSIYEKEL